MILHGVDRFLYDMDFHASTVNDHLTCFCIRVLYPLGVCLVDERDGCCTLIVQNCAMVCGRPSSAPDSDSDDDVHLVIFAYECVSEAKLWKRLQVSASASAVQ